MAQDPWKRAHQLQQLNQAQLGPGRTGHPPPRPQRSSWRVIVLLALLMLALGAAGYYYWLHREQWLPEVREELPEPIREALLEVRRSVDQAALEQGLGIQLTVFGNSLEMLEATRAWDVPWKLTTTGEQRVRLSGAGVKAYANADVIEFYALDVAAVYASPAWQQWLPELRQAGISPELSWKLLTGEEAPPGNLEYEYRSRETWQRPEGRVRQAFVLRFVDGYLRYVEGQIGLGPYRPPGPLVREAVQTEAPQAQPPAQQPQLPQQPILPAPGGG